MKQHHVMTSVIFGAIALASTPVRSDDAKLDPARNELSVFGGISIVDARRSQQTTISLPQFPDFPGLPGGTVGFPGDIQVNTETKLGDSALIGMRYAFYLRKQLAVEADFAVGPSHDLKSGVGLCGASRCYGFDAAMEAFFAGPMGGRFPGMAGMRGGEGHFDGGYGFGGRSLTAWHYGAGLTYDILGRDVRPFVVLGAGGVSYDGTAGAKTDFVLRFGAGVKVYFGRFGARVDAIDHLVFNQFLTGRDEHDVHITGGALVRF